MNPDILITNALIVPEPGMTDGISPGYVAVRGGLIEEVGPMADLPECRAGEVIDGSGRLVMPGLVNTHCHAAMTLFRGLADDLELVTWLNEHIFPAEAANVSEEMVYWCSKLAAAEMLLSGTTLVADGYFFEAEAAKAFSEAGMRAVTAQGVIDFPAPGVPDPKENIKYTARFLDDWIDRDDLIAPAVFVHSPYTCCAETIVKAKEAASSHDVPFFIHVAESSQEQAMIQEAQGTSPVKHLDALGVLDERTVCVHCVWVDEEDLAILAARKANVSICPQSHLKLSSGLTPLADMLAQKITVSLGTDGAASNNGLDMFREMDICAKVQKVRTLDPVAVKAGEVLRMATRSGAEVLGKGEQLGVLRKGYAADLILVDINRPHLQPFFGPDILVYAAGGADVRTVVINGRVVVQEGRILTIDLDETMARVRKLAVGI